MEKTKIELKYPEGSFIFPITPESYDVDFGVENVTVNIHDLGEILLKGKRKLRGISWSSFFPKTYYDFCQVPEGEMLQTAGYVGILSLLAANNTTCTVNITDFISMQVVVESFPHSQNDGTGDVAYSITLKEYRDVDSPTADKQTAKRPTKGVTSHLYQWKNGDTWKKVAKKETGKTENWTKLKKTNDRKITVAVKAYKKKHPAVKTVKDEVALVGTKILIK